MVELLLPMFGNMERFPTVKHCVFVSVTVKIVHKTNVCALFAMLCDATAYCTAAD